MLGWRESYQDTLGNIDYDTQKNVFREISAIQQFQNIFTVTSPAVGSWMTSRLWPAVETWPVHCGMLKQVCGSFFLWTWNKSRKSEINWYQKLCYSPSPIPHWKIQFWGYWFLLLWKYYGASGVKCVGCGRQLSCAKETSLVVSPMSCSTSPVDSWCDVHEIAPPPYHASFWRGVLRAEKTQSMKSSKKGQQEKSNASQHNDLPEAKCWVFDDTVSLICHLKMVRLSNT